jgi:hypothetical protein
MLYRYSIFGGITRVAQFYTRSQCVPYKREITPFFGDLMEVILYGIWTLANATAVQWL